MKQITSTASLPTQQYNRIQIKQWKAHGEMGKSWLNCVTIYKTISTWGFSLK